ncbi:diguanylate cyclase [Maridesulfovibrio sp.]|uniref:diguanylate cyclase n=1 Tax=Maridesulfovibrio sp. TaxID=2795000 RepID=UPI002A18DE09|nr:diguanylate cyclase [Maridesulfovibrio sp.]
MFARQTQFTLWGKFIASITAIVILIVFGIFVGIFIRNKDLIQYEIEARARAHFHNILLARRWNAQYGGVFVEKKQGIKSNPYLANPDIHTIDGKVYTKKNPALMTREMSVLADKEGLYSFHITSLKPLNPDNAPDKFETEALKSFESGELEKITEETINGRTYFRYIAPLYTENPCLPCHSKQGYTGAKGEVRGGISVKFDISDAHAALETDNKNIIVLCMFTLVLLLGLLYGFIFNIMNKLNAAMQRISEMAVTDALTGLKNRRDFFEHIEAETARAQRHRSHLSCIMMDVDHFKKVNDTYGHPMGDKVLKKVARILTEHIRISDYAARFGGEEFVILLPETDIEGARVTAEKIRSALKTFQFITETGESFYITSSFGCSSMENGENAEALISMADESLYRAKARGRDRVVCMHDN